MDTALATPDLPPIDPSIDQLHDNLFVFQQAKISIDQIITNWSDRVAQAQVRRDERYVRVNVEELRQTGRIAKDQTFIPDRVIDGNIIRGRSEIMAFLNSGYRLGIFECLDDPFMDENKVRRLETEVTQGLTYNGWYDQYEKTADGAELHGLDYVEVVFDETKTLHVGFEHVGYDRLFYNQKVADIQDSEWLLRKYEIPVFRLEQEFVNTHGFDPEQVKLLTQSFEREKRNDTITLYKGFFKYGGVVFVSWFAKDRCTNWLRAPIQHRVGIWEDKDVIENNIVTKKHQEADLTIYPIFTDIYRNDEQEILVDHEGRAFLDGPQQEANTAIITGFVNGIIRSNNIYASPKIDDGESAEMKVLDVELVADGIYNRALEFWNMPAPSVEMLQALQVLDNKNAVQSGQVAFAANNRKDSRKTATELDQAETQQSKITSSELAGFSGFMRNVLEFAWLIIQSQALEGKIPLMLIPSGPVQEGQPPTYVNDNYVISRKYDIRPAGNTDVIESNIAQQKMQQDWPVVQLVPGLKDAFLMDYLKLRYPKQADRYIAAMAKGNPAKGIVQSLETTIVGLLEHPDEIQNMKPEDQYGIQQTLKTAQNYIQTAV